MRCVADPDLTTFAERALPLLQRDPVRNNVACTIIDQRHAGPVPTETDAVWLRVLDDRDRLITAALRTPPYPLLLTAAPEPAVAALVAHLRAADPALPMVTGPEQEAGQFARRWSAATGQQPAVTMRQRLFRLDAVTAPEGVPGRHRAGRPADRDLLIGWLTAFHTEAMPDQPFGDAAAIVDRGLTRGDGWWLWEADGEPVSMLSTSSPVAGVVRIGAVYTPPARRGNGYASSSVAAASQGALDQGAGAAMLYTDVTNPTSNKIYQAVGYRPVGDATTWRLGS